MHSTINSTHHHIQIYECLFFQIWPYQELNVHLKTITRKLNLNSPLRINKARECFASTLNRANKSVVKIAETMGHSTVAVTINYYIGGMNNDELLDLHDSLF